MDGTTTSKVTYHDSRYLGSYNQILEPQRELLKSISGVNLVEMTRLRSTGLCCGGGDGRMWLEENTGTRINNKRVEDVIAVNAQTVASACPLCMTLLDDGTKALSVDEMITREDIAELVLQRKVPLNGRSKQRIGREMNRILHLKSHAGYYIPRRTQVRLDFAL